VRSDIPSAGGEWLCTTGGIRRILGAGIPAFGVSIRAHRSQLGRQVAARALVVLAAVPLLVALYQFVLITLFYRHNHYDECAPSSAHRDLAPCMERGAVIGTSIDRLMLLDYPWIRSAST